MGERLQSLTLAAKLNKHITSLHTYIRIHGPHTRLRFRLWDWIWSTRECFESASKMVAASRERRSRMPRCRLDLLSDILEISLSLLNQSSKAQTLKTLLQIVQYNHIPQQ